MRLRDGISTRSSNYLCQIRLVESELYQKMGPEWKMNQWALMVGWVRQQRNRSLVAV